MEGVCPHGDHGQRDENDVPTEVETTCLWQGTPPSSSWANLLSHASLGDKGGATVSPFMTASMPPPIRLTSDPEAAVVAVLATAALTELVRNNPVNRCAMSWSKSR